MFILVKVSEELGSLSLPHIIWTATNDWMKLESCKWIKSMNIDMRFILLEDSIRDREARLKCYICIQEQVKGAAIH